MSNATLEANIKSAPGIPELMPIPLATLSASHSLGVDLYLKTGPKAPPTLYRDRKVPVTADELERLAANNIRVGYIPADQGDDYQQYLRENVETYLYNETIPVSRRYEFLSETAREVLRDAFRTNKPNVILTAADQLGDKMVDLMSQQDDVASDLFYILRHDYHTFTHCFNVASYSLALARALGISDPAELKLISVGGLVHDLGKLRISAAILTKPGPLTPEERAIIQRHPRDGFVELCRRNDLTWGQLMMVYQHHERIGGKGYPVGVGGEEIHTLGRLCAVVDVFEAMTSNRPYRKSLPIPFVLEHLNKQAGTTFDQEMVKCWTATMQP